MKLSLLVVVLPASCIVTPLFQVNNSATKFSIDVAPVELDVAPVGREPLNTRLANIGPRVIGPRDARTNPPCPAGQTFSSSICFTYSIISRFCNTAAGGPGERREIFCHADEVCVQRVLSNGRNYADCLPLVSVIKWRSGPSSSEQGCTDVSSKRGKTHSLGTIAYDTNSHPIQVDKILYLGEPGDVNKGIGGSTSFFTSEPWNFDGGKHMQGKYKQLIS